MVFAVETKRRGLDGRYGFAVGLGGRELSIRELAIL